MPYINRGRRVVIDSVDGHGMGYACESVGELTFALFRVAQGYLARHGVRFQVFAEIMGALEAAKLELYRRKVAPYEDQKIRENGDVF